MTTREDLLRLAEEWKRYNPKSGKPRYYVFTLDYPYSKVTYYVPWLGHEVTFPSPGIVEDAACYCGDMGDDLDDIIQFLNENRMGIQDGCYWGAFILLYFPGIMPFNTTKTRMFFRWDAKKDGFFQEEEPEAFHGCPIIPGDFSIDHR